MATLIRPLLITHVLNLETGLEIDAASVLSRSDLENFTDRRKQREALKGLGSAKYWCCKCDQPIQFRGSFGGNKQMHFYHPKGLKPCPLTSKSQLSYREIERRKFNGQKEGKKHQELKNWLATALEANMNAGKGVTEVRVERRIESSSLDLNKWRKPDVFAIYQGRKIAFELQLSTTFIDVIIERDKFYRDEGIYLVWVFASFNKETDRKFTESDAFVSNFYHAFSIDNKAIDLATEWQDLVLRVDYLEARPQSGQSAFVARWNSEYKGLTELQFHKDRLKLLCFDYDKSEDQIYRISERQKVKSLWLEERRKRFKDKLLHSSKATDPIVLYLAGLAKHDGWLPGIQHAIMLSDDLSMGQFLADTLKEELDDRRFSASDDPAAILAEALFYYRIFHDPKTPQWRREKDLLGGVHSSLNKLFSLIVWQVVGTDFDNVIQTIHTCLQEKLGVFVKEALQFLGKYESLVAQDKEGKLVKKFSALEGKPRVLEKKEYYAFRSALPKLAPLLEHFSAV